MKDLLGLCVAFVIIIELEYSNDLLSVSSQMKKLLLINVFQKWWEKKNKWIGLLGFLINDGHHIEHSAAHFGSVGLVLFGFGQYFVQFAVDHFVVWLKLLCIS